jgi:hypothetical protein
MNINTNTNQPTNSEVSTDLTITEKLINAFLKLGRREIVKIFNMYRTAELSDVEFNKIWIDKINTMDVSQVEHFYTKFINPSYVSQSYVSPSYVSQSYVSQSYVSQSTFPSIQSFAIVDDNKSVLKSVIASENNEVLEIQETYLNTVNPSAKADSVLATEQTENVSSSNKDKEDRKTPIASEGKKAQDEVQDKGEQASIQKVEIINVSGDNNERRVYPTVYPTLTKKSV